MKHRDKILDGDQQPDSPFRPENIPKGLRELDVWVGWKWDDGSGRWTKPPVDIKTGRKSSATDPNHWYAFDEALRSQRAGTVQGLGVALGETVMGYLVGVDLDDVRDPNTGQIDAWAQSIVDELDSYTEISPTGTGLKVFILSDSKIAGSSKCEVYHGHRYFTITGLRLQGVSQELEERTNIAVKIFGIEKPWEPSEEFEFKGQSSDFSLAKWLDDNEVENYGVCAYGDYRDAVARVQMPICPFCGNTDRPSAIIIAENGRLGYSCFHKNHCGDKHWRDFRERIQGDRALVEFDVVEESEPAVAKDTQSPQGFSASILGPPGLMGEIIGINLASAPYPQPLFALSSAIGLMATLCGRVVCDPLDIRSNLYAINVGPSGCGKAHGQKVNRDIADAIGIPKLASADWPTSEAGLLSALNELPSRLFQPEEVGKNLEAISGKRTQANDSLVAKALLQAFTLSNSVYVGQSHAKSSNDVSVLRPNACILGGTTNDVYRSLSKSMLTDGFLGRFMFFEVEFDARERNRDVQPLRIPDSIKEQASKWVGRLAAEDFAAGEPDVIEYGQGIADRLSEFQDHCDKQYLAMGSDSTDAVLWTRTAEKARKLALIYACSLEATVINAAAVDWAIELSEELTIQTLKIAEHSIAGDEFDAQCQKFLKHVRAKARADLDGWTVKRDVIRAMTLRVREYKDIEDSLRAQGRLEVGTVEKDNEKKKKKNTVIRVI